MFQEQMRQKEDRELINILLSKNDYQAEAYEAAILEAKKRGLKVKWHEVEDFNTQIKKERSLNEKNDLKNKKEDIVIGLLVLTLGVLFSTLLYFATQPGERYIIAAGAITYGIYRIFR